MALEEAGRYYFFAERWRWPPQVVDDMPAWLQDRMVTVAAVHDEIAEDQRRRQKALEG